MPVSSILTPEGQWALLGEAVKSRIDADKFNAKLREIDDKAKEPLDRARLKFELIVKIAVEAFGADPGAFDDLGCLLLLAPMLMTLNQDLAEFGSAADIGDARRKAMVSACYAINRFLAQAGRVVPGYSPAAMRPIAWIMEALVRRTITARQARVQEAVGLSTWYFHNRARGISLEEAARHICLKLGARGVKRTRGELIRYREEIDCDNHDQVVRMAQASRAPPSPDTVYQNFAKLTEWATSPPKQRANRAGRKTTDKARQAIYDHRWPIVETVVEGEMAIGHNESIAVERAIEILLDLKNPRRTVWSQPPAD